jgi:hypothetical protein
MIPLISSLALSVAVGWFAQSYRGRPGRQWFFLSLVISPILAFLIVFFAPSQTPEAKASREMAARMSGQPIPTGDLITSHIGQRI